ncbi:MAG: SUMF1/EgtB/PvdO family nonheme iron enzyme [Thermoguttaceae bacterium]
MFDKTILRGLLAAAVVASAASVRAGVISIAMVPVGDAGNVADPATGYGAVSYDYNIGKYDVTLGQYTTFLNDVAKTDTYGLYNSYMAGAGIYPFGISQSGSSGNYSYSVTGSNPQAANMPVYAVSWGDAARFCNWLQNGQPTSGTEGTGTTETGAYTLNGDVLTLTESRNAGATYFIPNENEWYKAAYYSGGGTSSAYYQYPTKSDVAPNNSLALALSTSNEANYYSFSGLTDPVNHLTPVGAFAASPGPYGTFDMGGDVWEWNEAIIFGSYRGFRCGNWDYSYVGFASSNRNYDDPTDENQSYGFRVASSVAVPEPSSLTLLLAGAVGMSALAWWRKMQAT